LSTREALIHSPIWTSDEKLINGQFLVRDSRTAVVHVLCSWCFILSNARGLAGFFLFSFNAVGLPFVQKEKEKVMENFVFQAI